MAWHLSKAARFWVVEPSHRCLLMLSLIRLGFAHIKYKCGATSGFRACKGQRNVLIESKRLSLLNDVCTGPPCRKVSHPKSWWGNSLIGQWRPRAQLQWRGRCCSGSEWPKRAGSQDQVHGMGWTTQCMHGVLGDRNHARNLEGRKEVRLVQHRVLSSSEMKIFVLKQYGDEYKVKRTFQKSLSLLRYSFHLPLVWGPCRRVREHRLSDHGH